MSQARPTVPSAPRTTRKHSLVRRTVGGLAVCLALLSSGLTPGVADAHDHWMVAASRPMPGHHEITLDVFVGEALRDAELKGFRKDGTTRFTSYRVGESVDLLAGLEAEPQNALKLTSPGPGTQLFALDRGLTLIELEPQKFNDYLAMEGFGDALEARTVAGEMDNPGRERYRRFLKALVQLDDPNGTGTTAADDKTFATVVGQDLEIIPEVNPSLLGPGQLLPVRVLWHGKPLANAELTAASQKATTIESTKQRTDADGRAEVVIDRVGFWMLRVVHMERCQDCSDADWESAWASLTFTSTPPAPGAPVAAPLQEPTPDLTFIPDRWTSAWIALMLLGLAYSAFAFRRRYGHLIGK